MAIIFDEVSIKGLRITHFDQLLNYLYVREREGWSYGNPHQFEKRHNELQTWLNGIIEYASKEDVVIPKK